MHATFRSAALAAAVALTAFFGSGAASAQNFAKYNGYYISGMAGLNTVEDTNISGTGVNTTADFDDGWAGVLSFGRAFGNGLRLEGELGRRLNDVDDFGGTRATGDVGVTSAMINALYDFDLGFRVIPYVGVGLGLAHIQADASPIGGSATDDTSNELAWQAMLGVAFPVTNQLAITAEARHFNGGDPNFHLASGTSVNADYEADSFMIGVRFNFAPPAAPPPAPEPQPAAEPAPQPAPEPAPVQEAAPAPAPAPGPRSFLIFFDWDRANIRPDARQILEAAANAAKNGQNVRIQLTGHADRSGPNRYNQRLSERRAANAKAELVKLGIAADSIATVGRGESEPLVATDDGVREPRNRRVEIMF